MRPELQAVATRNAGVFRRADAVRCGYSERRLKTLTGHGGAWVVVRRGCYAERAVWEALDDEGRYALRVRAALLAQQQGGLPSHASAAVLLGLPTRPAWRDLVHVTRPGVTGSRTENGVKHHLAAFDAVDVTRSAHSGCWAWRGRPSTSVASTATRTASWPPTPRSGWVSLGRTCGGPWTG